MAAWPAHGQDAQKKDGAGGCESSPSPGPQAHLHLILSFLASWGPCHELSWPGSWIHHRSSHECSICCLSSYHQTQTSGFYSVVWHWDWGKNGFTGYPKPCKSWWILCPNNTLSILSVSRHYCPLESHHWPYIPTQQTPQASSSNYRFNYQSRKTKQGPGKLWKASLF